MNMRDLEIAIAEAERFLSAANDLKKTGSVSPHVKGHIYGGVLPAYVRRASMDLTRALAALRRRTGWLRAEQ